MTSKKILIIGGSGYVGSKLILELLKKKFYVVNYDLDLFGAKHLPKKNKKFFHIKGDIRDLKKLQKTIIKNKPDTIIHLACISNDPSFELDNKLSKKINYDSFFGLMNILKKNKISKFIFASTCSVYGVSKRPKVTESHPLKPITAYNKYKAACEKIFLRFIKKKIFKGIIIRPATVCGVSPKMRFDLTVNILTNFAYKKKFIKVFGGSQKRPNTHIDDMVRLYVKLSKMNISKHNGQIFNCGFENYSVNEIANKVKNIVEKKTKMKINIFKEKSNDLRSYHVNSDKIKRILNFKPKKKIDDAIEELVDEFEKGRLNDRFTNLNYFNIKKLIKLKLK